MPMGICYIVGAGDFSESEIKLGGGDLLIAADGGYENLRKIGAKPHIVIGDFDSLDIRPEGDTITLPREKDITDTAAALDEGMARGYKKFRIFGGTGGREEHTIANIQNVAKLSQMGCFCEILDKSRVITAVCNGEIEFDESHKGFISVFSHSDMSEGVSENGLKYKLDNVTLKNCEPLGVSNEFIGQKAKISVKRGTLIIIYDRQDRL